MGIYDRDYLREPPRRASVVGSMRMWSVATWLIVINVVVFLIDAMSERRVALWGYFSAETAIHHLQLWRFVTYQFLHAGVGHLFFNMLSLYFFGPFIEQYLGSRRFIVFYLLCGIGGALMYLLLWGAGLLITAAAMPMVGASAGIFGVLIAAARIAPDTRVMLLFPPIPIHLKTLAWILIAIALFTIFRHGQNAGGEAAHLGGAAFGAILIRRPGWLSLPRLRLTNWR